MTRNDEFPCDPFDDIADAYRKQCGLPANTVGLVFKEDFRKEFHKRLSSGTCFWGKAFPRNTTCQSSMSVFAIYGIKVYFDSEQTEDCLSFQDAEFLEKYLNRHEDPKNWGLALVEFLPKQTSNKSIKKLL